MPIPKYGVLKGSVVDCVPEFEAKSPHYQVQLRAKNVDYRIAVNVKSTDPSAAELLFHVDENFRHPITAGLVSLAPGYTPIGSQAGGLAIDYIRGNVVDRMKMRKIPHDLPGADNDLNEKLDHYVGRAKRNPNITIYAFGSRWGPEGGMRDSVFRFKPGNGIHDIHMNQGSPIDGGHSADNGIYQDGALLIHMAPENRWVAIFLAFQSQAWHTNDRTGDPEAIIPDPGPANDPSIAEPDYHIRIIAALINPKAADLGHESVTLLNPSAAPIDLNGWKLVDKLNHEQPLAGVLAPGDALRIRLLPAVQLGNKGGTITLLDNKGLKVDGAAYTAEDAKEEGVTVVF